MCYNRSSLCDYRSGVIPTLPRPTVAAYTVPLYRVTGGEHEALIQERVTCAIKPAVKLTHVLFSAECMAFLLTLHT